MTVSIRWPIEALCCFYSYFLFFNHIVDSETDMFLCVSTGCACRAVNKHDDS